MNFSQKLGLFILILITVLYVYLSFFNKDFDFKNIMKDRENPSFYNPLESSSNDKNKKQDKNKLTEKNVKIFT